MPKHGTAGPRLSAPDGSLLEAIRSETRSILSGALGTTTKDVALLDFPEHRNFGDALIWQGTQRYLSELGFRVRYVAGRRGFKDHHLRKLPGNCLIIMQGGGNLGDLYPQHEIFRRHVVSTFPHRRIVIMPQTVHFADRSALAESVAVYRRATGLTILLREPMSMGIADDAFGSLDYRFCPDHAFGAPLEATRRHSRGQPVVLGRNDKEARDGIGSGAAHSVDWSPSRTNAHVWKTVLRGRRALGALPPGLGSVTFHAHQRSYAVLNWANVRAATRQLDGAPWVATNRLHAHVLSILLGIPHVVTDNSYGKISSIYDAYSGAFSISHWAGSLDEAVRVAKTLGAQRVDRSDSNAAA